MKKFYEVNKKYAFIYLHLPVTRKPFSQRAFLLGMNKITIMKKSKLNKKSA